MGGGARRDGGGGGGLSLEGTRGAGGGWGGQVDKLRSLLWVPFIFLGCLGCQLAVKQSMFYFVCSQRGDFCCFLFLFLFFELRWYV